MYATEKHGFLGNRWEVLLVMLLLTALVFLLSQSAIAAEKECKTQRPRIGLVLGGGGARGGAHVGVLEVLKELRIPVDYVVGTSMGSIVGGLYASGMSPDKIETEMRKLDWNEVFQDSPSREDLSFRRKEDDYSYAFKFKPGFNHGKIEFPLALIRGQKFDLTLNRLLLPVVDVTDFDNLPIPFRAVATDIETGKKVVLASGNLSRSIHASMAVPAVFDPVELDGRLLVDGGISDNVPVDVARQMGADVLIVVDVGSGLLKKEEITGVLSVSGQLANYLFTLNTEQQLKTLGPKDVLIRPQLGDISGGGFGRVNQTIEIGERAALGQADSLKRYSLSPQDYACYLEHHEPPEQKAPVINSVRIENHSKVADAVIADRIKIKTGQPLDVKKLDSDIGQVYGLDIFESVRYDVVKDGDKNTLVVIDKDKQWGPGYLQFGLASSNNLKGNSTFKAGALYTRTEINKLNGEWRLALQLGDSPGIFTQLYQPLDPLSRYFASGKVGYGKRNLDIFDNAGNRIKRYQLASYQLELALGREFGTWGQGRIGYRRSHGTAKVTIGPPSPAIDEDRGELFLGLSDDKLDSVNFPTTGHFIKAEYHLDRTGLGASTNYNQAFLTYLHAFSWGHNILLGKLFGFSTVSGTAPLNAQVQLGGFLRLSGLQENQLSGQYAGLVSLVYMHRMINFRFFQSYLGASIERGNAWKNSAEVSYGNTITAGSLFLGMDTPIGPLYLGYGRASTGDQSLYIYLGPRFTF